MKPASTRNIARFVAPMFDKFDADSAAGRKLAAWLAEHGAAAGVDWRVALGLRTRRAKLPPIDRPLPARMRRSVAAVLAAVAADPLCEPDVMASNLAVLTDSIGISELDRGILAFVLQSDSDHAFEALCNDLVATRAVDSAGLVACGLQRSRADVLRRALQGPLRTLDLLRSTVSIGDSFTYFVPFRIRDALLPPNDGLGDIERRLIGAPLRARLGTADFPHMAREADFALRLLRGTIEMRRRGINVLIYGSPGTGKTEFCKAVAAEIGCDLFAIGESGQDGDELSRTARIDALRLADQLAGRRGRAVLLFDEMEDILQNGENSAMAAGTVRRAGSKVFFNRLLERNALPVLWTANAIDEFDPAFLRRMSFAFQMRVPPAAERGRLWASLARDQGLALPREEAAMLAHRHGAVPSLIAGAAQAVAVAAGTPQELGFVVEALTKSIAAQAPPDPKAGAPFDPALANASTDLAALEAALVRVQAPKDVSFCFHGPSGTGKSAFARYLAERLNLDPLFKRGSDLLSRWIGGTEQRIARAFEQARDENRFLIIDEVEAFLWGRAEASRSWEVSMVNELLVALENHPLPFACTTNHFERIDPAALRRFDFKVKFGYLAPRQVALAYRQYFDRPPPSALRGLPLLTPGDFATVARKRRVLGGTAEDDAALLRLLAEEGALRHPPMQRIGF